jgi:UDP-glucose 4-epimerase
VAAGKILVVRDENPTILAYKLLAIRAVLPNIYRSYRGGATVCVGLGFNMKILVTGGAGFIGSHITDAYIKDGHEVAVVDSLETGSLAHLNPEARFYEADMRDSPRLDSVFAEFKPEVVSHHAAQISVPHSMEDPAFDANSNIVGSLNVWRAARDCGARRLIFASSGGAIYGDAKELPIPESTPAAPLSPYGLSKQVFEMYLRQLGASTNMVPVILRYANVYGPRQGAGGEAGVVSIFVRRSLKGQQCTIFGDGSMTRDYVYVGDVVQANQIALTQGDYHTFNIASTTKRQHWNCSTWCANCSMARPTNRPSCRNGQVMCVLVV